MALTEKQVRNGVPGTSTRGFGGPSPSVEGAVTAAKNAAEEYGNAHAESGRQAWSGDTPGSSGYSVPDWDKNIAVTEGRGEA